MMLVREDEGKAEMGVDPGKRVRKWRNMGIRPSMQLDLYNAPQ